MNYILLILIGFIWGSQFLLINLCLTIYSSEQVALFRSLYAAIFLIIFCIITKKRNSYDWIKSFKILAISLLEIVIPFNLIIWGQKYISSSMTSIIIGTIPFFTLIIVSITKIEKSDVKKIISIIIGFIGLLILVGPDLIKNDNYNRIIPSLSILIGSFSFACALVIIKTMDKEDPFLLSRDTFIIGTFILFITNILKSINIKFSIYLYPFIASLILGIFCSGLVYVCYINLIKRSSASFCSLSNYIVPLFGTIIGIIILKDKISLQMIIAYFLISLSVTLQPMLKKKFLKNKI